MFAKLMSPSVRSIALGFVFISSPAGAVVYSWTGSVDGDWTNPGNWDGNGVPVDSIAGGNLELSAANEDRILFNAVGSVNVVPTSNIPALGGAPISNRPNITPQFDILHGSLVFSAPGFNGQGLVKNGSLPFTNTVGDGNTANGLVSLTYNGGFSQGINRDPSGVMVWTVNADGTLIFNAGSSTLVVDYGLDRSTNINLNGGAFVTPDALDLRRGSVDAGLSYFDFIAPGSSVTAAFGGDFTDLAAVQALVGDELTFRSSTSLSLIVTDNNDETFTVSDGSAPRTEALQLAIFPSSVTPGNYDFEWNSVEGKFYDLVSSTDLTAPVLTWSVWLENRDFEADSSTANFLDIPSDGEVKRFFSVIEKDSPTP